MPPMVYPSNWSFPRCRWTEFLRIRRRLAPCERQALVSEPVAAAQAYPRSAAIGNVAVQVARVPERLKHIRRHPARARRRLGSSDRANLVSVTRITTADRHPGYPLSRARD